MSGGMGGPLCAGTLEAPASLPPHLATLLEALKPAWRNGVPEVSAVVSDTDRKAYAERERLQKAAVQAYAERVGRAQEGVTAVRPEGGGRPVVTIADDARLTPSELKAVLGCAMPEQSTFAEVLNLRNSYHAKLGADESFEVRTSDGRLVAVVLRGILADDKQRVVEGYAFVDAAHERTSNGWFQGCEADQPLNPDVTKGLLSTPMGAAAMGITKGHHIHHLAALNGTAENRLLSKYTSTSTKEEERGGAPKVNPIHAPHHA